LPMAAVDNGDLDSILAGQLGGAEFGNHSPAAQRTFPVTLGFKLRRKFANHALQPRFSAAVGNHEAVDIGEQKQPVGLNRGGEQGTQFIIVSEPAFQLAYRDAVVLVDDRDNTQLQQLRERILQIAIAQGRGKVVAGEQKLGNDFFAEEEALVGVHQLALAHGGTSLHPWNVAGTLLQCEAGHAGGDGARSNDQIFVVRQIKLIHQPAKQMNIDVPLGSDKTGADFDDHAHLCWFGAGWQSLPSISNRESEAGGKGTTSHPAVRMSFWQVERGCAPQFPMPAINATSRFSDRVENYVLYRPGYPPPAREVLKDQCGLVPEHVIADIASGTGKWTQMLLENGNAVFGVEPNEEMRQAGERLLRNFPKFTSVAGKAEATTLADASVDFVTAAQAAHWFDRAAARREFRRILKPGGWLVLLWNERRLEGTSFLRAYEQLLLTYGTDYADIRHERTTAEMHEFFDPEPFEERVFPMRQDFDYGGLEGRLLSSSYAPVAGHPQHEPMLAELRRIFHEHAVHGCVGFEYRTRVYYGHL